MSSTTGGLLMLAEMVEKLPPSERKIANFIMEHPEIAITCTASELGEQSETSGSAVIRLCKSLGLKGFQELKLKVAGDITKAPEEGYHDIKTNESHSAVIEKMTTNSIQTLRETAEILNQDELTKAVEALKNADTIHFFGVGASSIIALDAQQKLLRINKHAVAFADIHMAATSIANIKPNDVVVGISFSGETLEVAKILDLANKKGARTISLTKYGQSLVSELGEIKLFTSASKEATFRSGATSSRLAQLHVIDILFMCVATQQYDETIYYLGQTREAINQLNEKISKRNEQK